MLVVVIAVVVVVVTYPAGDHCVCPHKPHVRDEATGAGEVLIQLTTLPPPSGGHGIGMGVWGEGGGVVGRTCGCVSVQWFVTVVLIDKLWGNHRPGLSLFAAGVYADIKRLHIS